MRAFSHTAGRRRAPRVPRDATDAQLLAFATDGNADAFDVIVDRYRPALLRFCATHTRPERVDDAVQQTFLNAWLALERGTPVRELRPWLYSIARNASIDQLRTYRAELVELSEELQGGADPAVVAAARGEVDDVLRAVAELPERQRTALIETAVHGRATEHVADEMGLSGGALRQLVHRARTSVRGMVASVLPTPLASWFAQTGSEEGTRRAAALLGGAGQGATAAVLAATATVASVGAIGTSGVANLATDPADLKRSAASASSASSRSPDAGTTDPITGKALVRLPLPISGDAKDDGSSPVVAAAKRPTSDEARRPAGGDKRDERGPQQTTVNDDWDGDRPTRGAHGTGSSDQRGRSGSDADSGSDGPRSKRGRRGGDGAVGASASPRLGRGHDGGSERRESGWQRDPEEDAAPTPAAATSGPGRGDEVAPAVTVTPAPAEPEPSPAPVSTDDGSAAGGAESGSSAGPSAS